MFRVKITTEVLREWFEPLALTPALIRQVRDTGPGAVIVADVAEQRYRALAPASLDPGDRSQLIVYTHDDTKRVLATAAIRTLRADHHAWRTAADLATHQVRSHMPTWMAALCVTPTVLNMRLAMHQEGFVPFHRPQLDNLGTVIDTYTVADDHRVLATTALPAFTTGQVTCEATVLNERRAPLALANGPVSETCGAEEGAAGLRALVTDILDDL
jgi:hypothetical protein